MPPRRNAQQKPHPYRKPKPSTAANPSDPSRPAHKIPTTDVRDGTGIPGLSKLKASIRQTKRLLAKDNLEPGLRVQTERRLASLEGDLASAQRREVEKKNGARYHKVKFFERQKLLRLIKRSKKKLSVTSEKELSDKKKEKHEQELEDARVMLSYVLHYPNTQKYIALFPSSKSAPASEDPEEEEEEGKLALPALLHPTPDSASLDKPSQRRYDLLLETRRLMQSGTLKTEPEEDMKKAQEDGVVVGLGAGVEIGLGKSAATGAKGATEGDDEFFESGDE